MSSVLFDKDIIRHDRIIPGQAGDGITLPEYTALRNDINDLLARPVIDEIDDIPNVNAATPDDGDALLYDEASNTWIPGASGGTIATVRGDSTTINDVPEIVAWRGIQVQTGGTPGAAYMSVVFAGSGGVGTYTAAKSDHDHPLPLITREPISPGGYLSGGTRNLASTNVTLLDGYSYLIEAKVNMQVRGGDPGPCYYRFNITIDGNTRTSPAGENGFWAVQGVPDKTTYEHDRALNGDGSSIAVSASVSWHSGGGMYTDAGELVVTVTRNR